MSYYAHISRNVIFGENDGAVDSANRHGTVSAVLMVVVSNAMG